MLRSIVGFEIELTELQGKFKASQNKSDADWTGVRDTLTATCGPADLDELVRSPR